MNKKIVQSVAFALVCMILGILIALQMKNVNSENLTEANLAELQNSLIEYAQINEDLSARNSELNDYISLLENDAASEDTQIQSIIREKERAAIFAGLREVTNYGIEIQVSCAQDALVSDNILRTFVNELRGIGAQAISVNDERMVATSEIRKSSESIIINGYAFPASAKFTIKAITDPNDEQYIVSYMEDIKSTIISPFSQFVNDQYDIQITVVPELTIPALSENSIAFKIDLLLPADE